MSSGRPILVRKLIVSISSERRGVRRQSRKEFQENPSVSVSRPELGQAKGMSVSVKCDQSKATEDSGKEKLSKSSVTQKARKSGDI
ncbi:hypothetical protein NQZ68_000786 [Dissostichus eleginoides]|nr:hypothetical protein NQZ68_000786 [Dissostichus eleginoides]